MLMFRKILKAAVLGLLYAPLALSAQVRDVVSKEVSVGQSEATLRLEFADEGTLEISFEGGSIFVDGDFVGSFEPGDDLEAEWRALLGQAIALDDGALAQMLSDWTVPADLANGLADAAQEIDRALEEALSLVDIAVDAEDGSVSLSIGDDASFLRVLLNSTSRLGLMEQALENIAGDFKIHVEEDVVVPAGSVVEGTLVVIGGDAQIGGEVDGDIVVVDGTLELLEESVVRGNVRLADARLVRNLGEIDGDLVDVLEDERDFESELRDRVRVEVTEELRSELRTELRNAARHGLEENGFSLMTPFRPVIRGVGGLMENLIKVFILGLLGAAAVAFAGGNLDAIAETARRSPGRSAMVGFAGTLLLLPVWILGTVALAVSIIGIPVAVAWLPLFPIAACAAAVLGYLAVARNTGEWLSDSGYPWTGWIRKSNQMFTVVGGLLGLMFLFMAANVISIAPFLGFLTALLVFAGSIVSFMAVQIGFGAVILTRAGRRREWNSAQDPDAAWEAAMDAEVDIDPVVENDNGNEEEEVGDA
jgi:cytoskeletal protein CcmA (bactofilin family)